MTGRSPTISRVRSPGSSSNKKVFDLTDMRDEADQVFDDDLPSPPLRTGTPAKQHSRSEPVAHYPFTTSREHHKDTVASNSSAASSNSSRRTSMTLLSRHPSFSLGEGANSTGSLVDRPDFSQSKIIVAMVGLPARGKSYLSNKLMRYLRWLEYEVKVFNAGQLRRSMSKQRKELYGVKDDHSASFFDRANAEASKQREFLANECLEQLIEWLKKGGNVGIHDATNSSMERRAKLEARVKQEPGFKLFFLESICDDPAIIDANIAVKTSSGDPDYSGMTRETAEADFRKRIALYEKNYQTIDVDKESHLSWAKIINVGNQVQINKIDGYLESRICFYLMNLHLTPRSIYLTRHGESQYNVEGKIGGDAQLSPRGEQYMRALPDLIKEKLGDLPLTIWTSTLRRTIQTAQFVPYTKLTWKALDELDAGVCDGMTYEEIEEHYPEDYAARDDDKYNYRYRGGESYRDVVVRLEPVIMELERQENILLVCHQAVLRCLYAYLWVSPSDSCVFRGIVLQITRCDRLTVCYSHDLSTEELPYIKIPLHTVIKLTPKAYGCEEVRYKLPIDAVDTTRPKPVKVAVPASAHRNVAPQNVNINAPRDWSAAV